MNPPRKPALRLLLLGLALVWAQLALAEHGVEHAVRNGHEPGEACIECLALPGVALAPAPPARLPWPLASLPDMQVAVPPAPSFVLRLGFDSRAPPPLHR